MQLPSDSLLPLVEGNLTGYTESEAGRSEVTDKNKVGAGLNLATKFTRKYWQNQKKKKPDRKPVKMSWVR